MNPDDKRFRMDKTILSVTTLDAESDEKEYWQTKTPQERLEALEYMRQMAYGYGATIARLQRVLEVVERSSS